ncbi:hypothetical protein EMCRGX_G008777 [Ephydatia muelleri]
MANPKCNCCEVDNWPASLQNPYVCQKCVLWSNRDPNPNIYPIDDNAVWSIGCDCCNLKFGQSYWGLRYVSRVKFQCGHFFYLCKGCKGYGEKRCPKDRWALPLP